MDEQFNTELCRCCLTDGSYKNLTETFQWMGEDEVYGDMLKDCFDVMICDSSIGGICDVCITQLRNASNFKKQVLQSEQKFKKKLEISLKGDTVKIEHVCENDQDSDTIDQDSYFEVLEAEMEVPIKEEVAIETKSRKRGMKLLKSETKAKRSKQDPETSTKGISRDSKQQAENVEDSTIEIDVKEIVVKREVSDESNTTCVKCSVRCKTLTQLTNHLKKYHIPSNLSMKKIKKKGILINNPSDNQPINNYCSLKKPIEKKATSIVKVEIKSDTEDEIINTLKNDESMKIFKNIRKNNTMKKRNPYKTKNQNRSNNHGIIKLLNSFNVEKIQKDGTSYVVKDEDFTLKDSRYICNRCNHSYSDKHGLRKHLKYTHDRVGGRMICPHCNKRYVLVTQLKRHLREEHDANENLYSCGACDKSFSTKKALDNHHRGYHLQEKNFKCDLCDYQCYQKQLLQNHMSKHSDERKYRCRYCTKTFKRWNERLRHERIHTGHKPYECTACGKTFAQKASLNYHMSKYHPGVTINSYKNTGKVSKG